MSQYTIYSKEDLINLINKSRISWRNIVIILFVTLNSILFTIIFNICYWLFKDKVKLNDLYDHIIDFVNLSDSDFDRNLLLFCVFLLMLIIWESNKIKREVRNNISRDDDYLKNHFNIEDKTFDNLIEALKNPIPNDDSLLEHRDTINKLTLSLTSALQGNYNNKITNTLSLNYRNEIEKVYNYKSSIAVSSINPKQWLEYGFLYHLVTHGMSSIRNWIQNKDNLHFCKSGLEINEESESAEYIKKFNKKTLTILKEISKGNFDLDSFSLRIFIVKKTQYTVCKEDIIPTLIAIHDLFRIHTAMIIIEDDIILPESTYLDKSAEDKKYCEEITGNPDFYFLYNDPNKINVKYISKRKEVNSTFDDKFISTTKKILKYLASYYLEGKGTVKLTSYKNVHRFTTLSEKHPCRCPKKD